MEPMTQADPRDRNLDARIRRLAGWPLGTEGEQTVAIGDLIAAEGDDVGLICHADRGFLALENVAIAITTSGKREVRRIRAATRFGQGYRRRR